MQNEPLIETTKYSFTCLSKTWYGPVVIYISNDKFGNAGENLYREIMTTIDTPFVFCELQVKDWDQFLTPWRADAGMKNRVFTGNATWLLDQITTDIVPLISQKAPNADLLIAGYSLAGLFALWCAYESDLFDGVACCSGSLWYPKWKEYASSHKLQKTTDVYLSIGKNEKKTKHALMKYVEENMQSQYVVLKEDENADRVCMEYNEGGHFDNADERLSKGISWLLTK